MKSQKAFSLIELLIAISISSVIILGMTQGFRNVQKILSRSREILQVNKAVCLLFNQMERDFQTAFIPNSAFEKKKETKKDGSDKKDESKKKKITFFSIESEGEESIRKINNKKYELFKKASLVNTNPLQIWGQRKKRFVRIGYTLLKNKKKSTRDEIVYNLYRKETSRLENETFKEYENIDRKKKEEYAIRTHLIATNIKEMYMECSIPKQKKKSKTSDIFADQKEEKYIQSFSWGKSKEQENQVPENVEIRITFWKQEQRGEETFICTTPILSYPIEKPKEKPQQTQPAKPDAKQTQAQSKPQTQPQQTGTPSGPPAIPPPDPPIPRR